LRDIKTNFFPNFPTVNPSYYNYEQGGDSGSSQWAGGQSSSQGIYGTEGQQVPQRPPNVSNPIYIVYYAPRGTRRLAHFGVVIHFLSTNIHAGKILVL
jgi:hypothetical protein